MSAFLLLANASTAGRAAAKASEPATIASLVAPIWVLAIGVPLALLILAIVVGSARAANANKSKDSAAKTDFTKMLCERVWAHTDTALGKFAERLRSHPSSLSALQIQIRALREDLSSAALFIDYMKAYQATGWPSPKLFNAYSAWAGQLAAMQSQLTDLFAQISRPIAQEPIDKDREKRLISFYETEQRVLNRGVDKLHTQALHLCEAAREFLKKQSSSHGFSFGGASSHDDDEDGHHHCPCCARMPDKHVQPRIEELPVNVINIEAPPKDREHKPAAAPPMPQLVSAAPVLALQPVAPPAGEKKSDH